MKRILMSLFLALSMLVGTVGTASTAEAVTKRRCHIDIWLTPYDPADGDNGWTINSRLTRRGVPMAGKLVWYQTSVSTHTGADGTSWASYSINVAHGDAGGYVSVAFDGNRRTKPCRSAAVWMAPR